MNTKPTNASKVSRSFFQNCNSDQQTLNESMMWACKQNITKIMFHQQTLSCQAFHQFPSSQDNPCVSVGGPQRHTPIQRLTAQFRRNIHITSTRTSPRIKKPETPHDLETSQRTAPNEARIRKTWNQAQRKVLCSFKWLLLSSSVQIVSDSRSTTHSKCPRWLIIKWISNGIGQINLKSQTSTEMTCRQLTWSSGTECRIVQERSLICYLSVTSHDTAVTSILHVWFHAQVT